MRQRHQPGGKGTFTNGERSVRVIDQVEATAVAGDVLAGQYGGVAEDANEPHAVRADRAGAASSPLTPHASPDARNNAGGTTMNLEQIKGQWKQVKGAAKAQWGRLTDDELTQVEGNAERLVGLVQERYGYAKDQAQKEVDSFFSGYDSTSKVRS